MVQVEFGIVTSSYANHTLEFPGYLWPLATEILYLLPFSHPDQLTHASIMFIVGTLKSIFIQIFVVIHRIRHRVAAHL